MGCKEKLLKQLVPMFPENISTFYDLFAGSGVVSMNVNAEKYVLNDLSEHLYNLYNLFKSKTSDEIVEYCHKQIEKYGLTTQETNQKKMVAINKTPFQKMREDVNKCPSAIGFLLLSFYSFCNQFRFSEQGKFNMPVGNGYFGKNDEQSIKNFCDFIKNNKVEIFNKSYDEIEIKQDDNCFVYMDVPYCNTNAVYNETSRDLGGWTEKNDFKFFEYCEELNKRNIKWCVSNVFCNKGKANQHLIEWCERNNWTVVHLNMKYASHGVDNNKTDEVAIFNYKTNCYLF